ncbi:MAG TPA: sigma 54-interacting transcriptional regulator, partial [Ktedonobacterales bacterium]|nr:sigma 54-interacting transcriptional regulator [Ktedonobacterales bacterium]
MADKGRRRGAGSSGEERASIRILVCDDDAGVRDVLAGLLNDEGYEVAQASTGQQALEELTKGEEGRPALALLDIRMPDLDGIAVLQQMLEQGVDVPVILMTGFSTASKTIKAMQMGAADYLTKPFDLDEVTLTVQRVLRYEDLKRGEGQQLVPAAKVEASERIIGSSPEMIHIFKIIGQVARTPATVLLTGETGTGKELMAEAIHNSSDRRAGPLIKVNCAALPETLLESELFGHEKGSFTGALNQHKGRFEAANKGTIFL